MSSKSKATIKQDDYVIIRVDEKNHLVKVTSKQVGETNIAGILEKNRAYDPKDVTFDLKQVIANLGPKPQNGSAYGCKVEPWKTTKVHKFWGDVHIFRSLSKDDKKALFRSLDKQAEFLTKNGLGFFAPLSIEIRPANGTYSGMYSYRPKEGQQDILTLCPKSFSEPNKSQELVGAKWWADYVVIHESAHGIWYRGCSSKIKARWIEAYHSMLQLRSTDPKDVIKMGKSFVKDLLPLDEFRSNLPEEKVALFDACLSWIKDYHNLSAKHLKTLCEAEEYESIGKMWPTESIYDSDFELPLGEYATKNPEEFFAEAFALHFSGNMKIPRHIRKLLEKTLSKIKQ